VVTALRVAVVGGGIGGLCLAQGLRRSGVDVMAYEQDSGLDKRRQGYRIHLDGRAGRALHACLPRELFGLPEAQLHRLAAEAISGWHPDLRALVDRAEIAETFLVRINTSEPTPPWPAARVTVIGDAIHAMSPAGGSGANTALTDAALLRAALVRAARGEQPLLEAVGDYETRMREYGYAAVAAAGQATTGLWARRHPMMARIARLLGKVSHTA
jgi:2-polyprenyl-6-methoxyphenol hydroxylase-like FAD-dependent oxidoreductase